MSRTFILLAAALPLFAAAAEPRHLDFDACDKPHYPQADITAQHEGAVTLRFLVNPDGSVANSEVKKSSGYSSLDDAARDALAKCKFTPAAKGAKKQAWIPVKYVWTLK